jgi:hypothetical protein
MPKSLKQQFLGFAGRDIYKWEHYFDIYDRHCSRYVNGSPKVLEIGVMRGGSLQLWKNYFGPGSSLHGVDINPRCKQYEEESVMVHIGDQGNEDFLRELGDEYGPFDVVIDDGSHQVHHQKITLEALWPYIKNNGVYICEDTHTSYFTRFGGGYGREGTFIERAKGLVDCLHMWWSGRMSREQSESWTSQLASVHFYPACVVLEKQAMTEPNAIWNEGGAIRREPGKHLIHGRDIDPTG